MNKKVLGLFLVVMAALLVIAAVAYAGPEPIQSNGAADMAHAGIGDNYPHPLGEKENALRQKALEAQLVGKATGDVYEVARGEFVEMAPSIDEDLIWTVLGEFSNTEHPSYTGGLPGPQHNQIPEPDRAYNNTTIWVPDFDQGYFESILFDDGPGDNSVRNWYLENSSGAYAVSGEVTDWGQVEYNTARYGRYDSTVWNFVDESVDDWYARKVSAGWTPTDFDNYLSKYDVWDRYDYNGDGNFDEPDGYIDHMQSVHAGEGEEAGGGIYGSDAIWSHSWYAWYNANGPDGAGPAFNPAGGLEIGDTGVWVGKYTTEPENGGVGVFAHEFAHDLGLPDLYNTAGGGSAGENSTGFWTMMSSGSWLGLGTEDIGSRPAHFGNWEKFQLGWLDFDVGFAGSGSWHNKLGMSEVQGRDAQGLFIILPEKEVVEVIGSPYAGSYFFYSGSGADLDAFMYQEFTLGGSSTLDAMVNYDIETDWDYAYVVVSTDGGANWDRIDTDHSTSSDPNGQNFGNGITGYSGGWVSLSADLSAYDGQTVLIGFNYWTDPYVNEPGFMVDELDISGYPTDGAETDTGWTWDGFWITDGVESAFYPHYYSLEYRNYYGFDETLEVGPYNFGFLDDPLLGDWVEHFPYQKGLLINYWDTSQDDNNTYTHPGAGLVLPIDAHPINMIRADGGDWRGRIQTYDSTFTMLRTDDLTLHWNSDPSYHASQRAVRTFDDSIQYWNPATPYLGVMNPNTGTVVQIKNMRPNAILIRVGPKP